MNRVKRKLTEPSEAESGSCVSLLDEDIVLLLVVVEAEAVAGAERHQLPLRVQGEGGDHGGGLALHQGEGLEAGREQHGILSHVQLSVTLLDHRSQSGVRRALPPRDGGGGTVI